MKTRNQRARKWQDKARELAIDYLEARAKNGKPKSIVEYMCRSGESRLSKGLPACPSIRHSNRDFTRPEVILSKIIRGKGDITAFDYLTVAYICFDYASSGFRHRFAENYIWGFYHKDVKRNDIIVLGLNSRPISIRLMAKKIIAHNATPHPLLPAKINIKLRAKKGLPV